MLSLTNSKIIAGYCLTGLLLITVIVYYPGLDSLFLLDDQINLKDLAEINARGLWFYLFGTSAGPGGRPLSLLSFALQYESWPTDPFAFKLVNLLLHLINGALIFYLCGQLARSGDKIIPASVSFACMVTALWLLHPLQLSTVLYVVQRMTILSCLFVLVGILVYLAGRRAYLAAPQRRTVLFTLTGIYSCLLLAILGKETGILLVLYLLVLEFTLLSQLQVQPLRRWRRYTVPVLLLPLLGLGFYLFRDIDGLLGSYMIRDFTLGQRLMTESNVLVDYLRLILVPVSGAFSVFHDDYPVAGGLFQPAWTAINIAVLILLLGFSFYFRQRIPLLGFAGFWFLAGHLLESSVIPLELYFEHRNYLPLLGPLIFLCKLLYDLPGWIKTRSLGIALATVWPLAVLVVAVIEIDLWSKPLLQAHEWARQHPQSKRALNHLLNLNVIVGEQKQAEDALIKLRQIDTHDIYPSIKSISIANCYENRELPDSQWLAMFEEAGMAKFRGAGAIGELRELVRLTIQGYCPQLETKNLAALVDVLIANPGFHPVSVELYDVAANLAWLRQSPEIALVYLDKLITLSPGVDRDIFRLKMLMAAKQYPSAAALMQKVRVQLAANPRASLFYDEQIQSIERNLTAVGAL